MKNKQSNQEDKIHSVYFSESCVITRELFGYQILAKWSLISIFKQELSVNKFANACIHFLFSDYLFQLIQDILK